MAQGPERPGHIVNLVRNITEGESILNKWRWWPPRG